MWGLAGLNVLTGFVIYVIGFHLFLSDAEKWQRGLEF